MRVLNIKQCSSAKDGIGQYVVTQKEEMVLDFRGGRDFWKLNRDPHALLRESGSSPALPLHIRVHWGNSFLHSLHKHSQVLTWVKAKPWRHRWVDFSLQKSQRSHQLTEKPVGRATCKQVVAGERDRITWLLMEQAWRSWTDWGPNTSSASN